MLAYWAMKLELGGMDVFYVDESMDNDIFVICSLAIPFMRHVNRDWIITWESQFQNARKWRKWANVELDIPVAKELKGQKLASGRGRYKEGKNQLPRDEAVAVYRQLLEQMDFLPDRAVIGVVGTKASKLYDATRLEALLVALLQRMRTGCKKDRRTGMVFFDEGHGEYRKLYRRARVYLPTGSKLGSWETGPTKNLPLDNFTKDANIKQSQHSVFIQIADLIAYALLMKIRGEVGTLTTWQKDLKVNTLYESIPLRVLNTYASTADPLGIVRL